MAFLGGLLGGFGGFKSPLNSLRLADGETGCFLGWVPNLPGSLGTVLQMWLYGMSTGPNGAKPKAG